MNFTARSMISASPGSTGAALPSLTQPLACRTNTAGVASAATVTRLMLSGASWSTPCASDRSSWVRSGRAPVTSMITR